jgi:hypothetical protein
MTRRRQGRCRCVDWMLVVGLAVRVGRIGNVYATAEGIDVFANAVLLLAHRP